MDVYKSKIQSDGSIDKLKLIILVRGDLCNKDLIGDAWSPIASIGKLRYLLEHAVNQKARVHNLYFIGSFLQDIVLEWCICKVGQYICRLFSIIFNLFWKSLKIHEIYVWND